MSKSVFLAGKKLLFLVVICSLAMVMSVIAEETVNKVGNEQAAKVESKKSDLPKPPLKFFVFREDCLIKFQNQDFNDMECIKFTISKLIGLAIVVGAGILKVPQIIKILQNSSVEGLSALTLYIETAIFMQTAGLGVYSNLSFTVYGETLIIMVQNFIIMLMIWHYDKKVGFLEKFFIFSFMIGYAVLLFDPLEKKIMTDKHWEMVSQSSTVLNIIAKLPQIYTIYCNKSTGALAFFTFFLNFAGSIARCATVLFESDDFLFQLQFITGVFLNTIIIFQFFLYWNSSVKKVQVKVQPGDKANKMK